MTTSCTAEVQSVRFSASRTSVNRLVAGKPYVSQKYVLQQAEMNFELCAKNKQDGKPKRLQLGKSASRKIDPQVVREVEEIELQEPIITLPPNIGWLERVAQKRSPGSPRSSVCHSAEMQTVATRIWEANSETRNLVRDLDRLPDAPRDEDYDSFPVEEFGAALLRGLTANPAKKEFPRKRRRV